MIAIRSYVRIANIGRTRQWRCPGAIAVATSPGPDLPDTHIISESAVPPALLTFRNISKLFGNFRALSDIELDVVPGEFLTLLGPSGSGKTTLLMILAGFVAPSSGRIDLNGSDISALLPDSRDFGMVFQGYALFPHMTVRENVEFPLRVRKVPAAERRSRVDDSLGLVQMEGFADRLPKELSGGQQQRVALARAMVFDPKVMLLDEPLGALDRQLRLSLQDELKALHQKLGTTFICVTHDQDEAMSMSDRIVVMRNGRIIQVGPPLEIYEKPQTCFVANFLGESNLFRADIINRNGGMTTVRVGDRSLDVGGVRTAENSVSISVRPERLTVSDMRAETGFSVPATITDVTFVGIDRRVKLFAPSVGPLIARVRENPAPSYLQPGAEVWVTSEACSLWCVAEDD